MARTALTALMVRRQMAQTVVQLAVTAASQEMAAMAPTAAARILKSPPAARAALSVTPTLAALAATLLADRAATAATAATVDRLMAAVRLVASAAPRPEEMAASGEMAATVATAVAQTFKSRPAALAALPVISQRVALAATLLADRAATGATAATVGRLMAATRLVAMAGC